MQNERFIEVSEDCFTDRPEMLQITWLITIIIAVGNAIEFPALIVGRVKGFIPTGAGVFPPLLVKCEIETK